MVEKGDIIGGLKNALERGESLEKAKATFIAAGYSSEEVEEAAKLLGEKKEAKITVPAVPAAPAKKAEEKPLPALPEIPKPEKPKKKKNLIRTVLILVAVIILLLILNLVRTMLGIKLF